MRQPVIRRRRDHMRKISGVPEGDKSEFVYTSDRPRIMSDFSLSNKRVFVAGHRGMVGSSLCRRLQRENCNLLTMTRAELDLRDSVAVRNWFEATRPEVVFIAAAKVGGIYANATLPADFLYDNLIIQTNIIHAAFETKVEKLMFLGSSCIYPRLAPQPIDESALLTGPLEPTNEWYAIAKIAGLKLAAAYRRQHGCDFISAMPTNLYGPGDNFDLETSHVMPALIRKAHEAKVAKAERVVVWGTGSPLREFLHVDDCADACVFLMKKYSEEEHVNVGSGKEISILELTKLVCNIVGFQGDVVMDLEKPDGTPRKLMSATKLQAMNWAPQVPLTEGIRTAYEAFLQSEIARGTP